HVSLFGATVALFPDGLPTRLPDGLPHADRHDLARPAGQAAHVPLGLGHQRLFLGDRRRHRADSGDLVWALRRPDLRGRRVSSGAAGVLRGASAAADAGTVRARASKRMIDLRMRLFTALVALVLPLAHPASAQAPLTAAKTQLVPFEVTPF